LDVVAKALLSDLPKDLLNAIKNDVRALPSMRSTKKMLKEARREWKASLRKTKNDPVRAMEAAAKFAGTSGTFRCLRVARGLGGCCTTLPGEANVVQAKNNITYLAEEDYETYATRDGWSASLRAQLEMEIARLMHDLGPTTKKSAGGRTKGSAKVVRWQNVWHVKLTLDARSMTRHEVHTEVMMTVFPKGKEGKDVCQCAKHIKTICIWRGKDTRDNVQANMERLMEELKSLNDKGIYYNAEIDNCLGEQKALEDREAAAAAAATTPAIGLVRVEGAPPAEELQHIKIEFWWPADMMAQCALLGHGCAGDNFCPHCNTTRGLRSFPFAMHRVDNITNFLSLADEFDMFPRTLHGINASQCTDWTGAGFRLSEEGFRTMTVEASVEPPAVGGSSHGANHAGMRKRKKPAADKRPKADSSRVSTSLFQGLDGWKDPEHHPSTCMCKRCAVPAGTLVRVIPRVGFARESNWLAQYWPGSAARMPFCALHCTMRVGEALLLNICNTVIAEGDKAVDNLNEAFKEVKITRRLKKATGIGKAAGEIYEKISLLGIEVMKLLEPVEGGNPDWMAIEVILKKLWPNGHAGTRPELLNYVERTSLLWRQWKRVVELMSERDAEVLRSNGGYATFGKECREFCTLYQIMFHESHCRSFYLHTLLAHAGDFMRELEKHDLTLGMMSNSGAERRHELGRLAFKRSLCSGAWKKRNPKLKNIRNLSVYLSFREISIWQYGMDLLSHHKARCAEAPEGQEPEIESFRAQIARAKLRPVLPAFSDGTQTVASETEDAPTGFSSAELAEIEGTMNAASVLEGHTRVPDVGVMRDPESEGTFYDPSTDPDLVQDADCCSESDGPGSDDFSESSESESDGESDVKVDLMTVFGEDAPMAGDDSDDDDYEGGSVRTSKRPCQRQTRSSASGQDPGRASGIRV
jgi:hypothetical protein